MHLLSSLDLFFVSCSILNYSDYENLPGGNSIFDFLNFVEILKSRISVEPLSSALFLDPHPFKDYILL